MKTPRCPSGLGFVPEAGPGSGVGTTTNAHTHGNSRVTVTHGQGHAVVTCPFPHGGEQPLVSGAFEVLALWHHPGNTSRVPHPPAWHCGVTLAVPAVSPALLPVPPLPRPRQPRGCSRLFLWELGRKARFAAPAPCQPLSPCHRLCRGHLWAPGHPWPQPLWDVPGGQQGGCQGSPGWAGGSPRTPMSIKGRFCASHGIFSSGIVIPQAPPLWEPDPGSVSPRGWLGVGDRPGCAPGTALPGPEGRRCLGSVSR